MKYYKHEKLIEITDANKEELFASAMKELRPMFEKYAEEGISALKKIVNK